MEYSEYSGSIAIDIDRIGKEPYCLPEYLALWLRRERYRMDYDNIYNSLLFYGTPVREAKNAVNKAVKL